MEDTQVENTSTEMSEVNLIDAVKKQVEYYFSKENLLSDPYLTSQMDAQMCVPITVVMKFAKMKALTQDESLLRKALVDSTIVSIQDNKIKANIKPPGRSTIILREIPSDAPPAEVAEIFNYPGAKTTTSIRSEIGDTWFVTMDTEEDAKDTLLDLRLKKRTFRGVSVKARLKTETVVRSFFPVNANPVAPFPGIMAPGVPMVDMRAFGYMGMPVPLMNADGSPVDVAVEAPVVATVPVSNETRSSPGKAAAPAASSATTPATAGAAKKGSATGKAAAGNSSNNGTAAASGRRQEGSAASGSNARSGAKGANGHKDGKKEEVAPRATIEINVANFPPLGGGEDLPVPTPGYKGVFQKYNADEIISIAKGVKETNLPAALKPQAHPLSMTVEANKDLLKRQRSFSIDETREQLRQGRPVMRDAVLPGKVDSRSLYYGDEAPAAAVAAKKETAPAAPASAHTTPSQGKKAPKEVPAPVSAPTEATTAASEVVDHVAAAAANLAITSPTASESAHMASPQKITPSTWAAMLKSSASAADALPLPVRTPAKEVKRTPAKDATKAAAKTPAAGKTEKEAPAEGRTRRKNSEGSREGSRPAKAEKEGSTSGSVSGANSRRKAEPGTPSRGNATKESTDSKADGETAAKTETSVSWGGKASFANILKLSAESEPFVPASAASTTTASSSARAPTTKDTSGSSNTNNNSHNAERRKGDRAAAPKSSSSSSKPAAAPAAAAPAASNGEWSTSTGKSRAPRDAKDKDAAKDKTGHGNGNNGANAKGAWARETLPALPAAGAETKA